MLVETGDLVDVLVTVGELFKRIGQHILFLVDEGENLHAVSNADAQRSWHDAFRRLADQNDNQSLGWIMTFYETIHEGAPPFMFEGDITSVLQNQLIDGRDSIKTVGMVPYDFRDLPLEFGIQFELGTN